MTRTYTVSCSNHDAIFDTEDNFSAVSDAIAWAEKHSGPEFTVNIIEVDGAKVIGSHHMSYRPGSNQWFVFYYDTWYALPHDKIESFFAASNPGWYLYKNCKPC